MAALNITFILIFLLGMAALILVIDGICRQVELRPSDEKRMARKIANKRKKGKIYFLRLWPLDLFLLIDRSQREIALLRREIDNTWKKIKLK